VLDSAKIIIQFGQKHLAKLLLNMAHGVQRVCTHMCVWCIDFDYK